MLEGWVIKGIFTGLTPSEKVYLLLHPTHASLILEAKEKAEAETFKLFGSDGVHNGTGDAFRHCYASALLARKIGAHGAKEFTSAHEAYSSNPAGERQMDLNNNKLGIAVALVAGPAADEKTVSNLCKFALDHSILTKKPVPDAKGYDDQ